MTTHKLGPILERCASGLSIAALVVIITCKCFASVRAQDNAWSLNGSAEPPPQGFEIKHVAEGFYKAQITIAPKIEPAGNGAVRVILDDGRVTKKVLERRNPGGSLVDRMMNVAWRMALAEIDYPYQRISKVRAAFDKGSTESNVHGLATYDLSVPAGATRLLSIEVTFAWQENQKTLIFAAQAKRTREETVIRYVISEPFSFEDLTTKRAKVQLQWKIDRAQADVDRAQKQKEVTTKTFLKVADTTYELSRKLSDNEEARSAAIRRYQALIAGDEIHKTEAGYLNHIDETLARMSILIEENPTNYRNLPEYQALTKTLRDTRLALDNLHAKPIPGLTKAYDEVSQLILEHAKIEFAHKEGLQSQETAAANLRAASEALEKARMGLSLAQAERKLIATQSSLQELNVTADGQLVYKATWNAGDIQGNLNGLAAAMAIAKQRLDEADATRRAAKDRFLSTSQEASRAMADLADTIWRRGLTTAFIDTLLYAKDVAQGAEEGGPVGALAAALVFVVKEKVFEAAEGEEDLEKEVDKEIKAGLDEEFRQGVPQPNRRAIAGRVVVERLTEAGVTTPTVLISAATAQEVEEAINSFIRDAVAGKSPPADFIINGIKKQAATVNRVKKLSEEAEKLGSALSSRAGFKNAIKGAITDPKLLTKLGLNIVTDAAAFTAKERLKQEETEAWRKYLVAERLARTQYITYAAAANAYWDLYDSYNKLLYAQPRVLNAADSGGSFKTQVNLPFKEGASIVITPVPIPTGDFSSARLGGEQAIPHQNGFHVQASGLASDRDNPRHVTLELVLDLRAR